MSSVHKITSHRYVCALCPFRCQTLPEAAAHYRTHGPYAMPADVRSLHAAPER